MVCPSRLQLLVLFLFVAGLLEGHAWARPTHPEEPRALASRPHSSRQLPKPRDLLKAEEGHPNNQEEAVSSPSNTVQDGIAMGPKISRPRHPYDSIWGWSRPIYLAPTSNYWVSLREDLRRRVKELSKFVNKTEAAREEAERKEVEQARNLTVTIKQISKTPLTINIEVKNNSTRLVTFLNISTPLDPDAFDLGLFRITPGNLKMVNFASQVLSQRPPKHWVHEEYIEISPGMTMSNNITMLGDEPALRQEWVRMLRAADKVEMQMKGTWRRIWTATRDEVTNITYKDTDWFCPGLGSFESNVIELRL